MSSAHSASEIKEQYLYCFEFKEQLFALNQERPTSGRSIHNTTVKAFILVKEYHSTAIPT